MYLERKKNSYFKSKKISFSKANLKDVQGVKNGSKTKYTAMIQFYGSNSSSLFSVISPSILMIFVPIMQHTVFQNTF